MIVLFDACALWLVVRTLTSDKLSELEAAICAFGLLLAPVALTILLGGSIIQSYFNPTAAEPIHKQTCIDRGLRAHRGKQLSTVPRRIR